MQPDISRTRQLNGAAFMSAIMNDCLRTSRAVKGTHHYEPGVSRLFRVQFYSYREGLWIPVVFLNLRATVLASVKKEDRRYG